MSFNTQFTVILTDDVARSKAFYIDHLGFDVSFAADWYVQLVLPTQPHIQLAVMDYQHETVPAAYRHRSTGLILSFEMDDVDSLHQRLVEAGLPIHSPLRDEAFGQRHFITSDPNGVLLDFIQIIPPSAEFAAHYTQDIWSE